MQCRVALAKPRNGLVVFSAFLSASVGLLDSLTGGNESHLEGMGPQLSQL